MLVQGVDRLQAQLLTSGLSQRNQPLYQVIHDLIRIIRTGFDDIEGQILNISGTSTPTTVNVVESGSAPDPCCEDECCESVPYVVQGPQGLTGPMGPPGMDGFSVDGDIDLENPPYSFQLGIGNSIIPGTVGSVLFIGANNRLAQDNGSFFWDDTNNRLGLGTSTPGGKLEISFSESTDQAYAMKIDGNHTTATAGTVYGAQFNARIAHTSGTQNAIQGYFSQVFYRGTSAAAPAVSGMTAVFARLGMSTPIAGGNVSGTITTGTGFEIDSITNQAGGAPAVTFSTVRGLIVRNQGAGTGA